MITYESQMILIILDLNEGKSASKTLAKPSKLLSKEEVL